jgi:intracellular multiplication protein IcmO
MARPGQLTIFTPINDEAKSLPLLVLDIIKFGMPLLAINETRDAMMSIERLSGEKEKLSGTIANELIKDLQMATAYPPEDRDLIELSTLIDITDGLSTRIRDEIKQSKSGESD